MVLSMETGTGIDYFESLPLSELERKMLAYNNVMDKRIRAIKNRKK